MARKSLSNSTSQQRSTIRGEAYLNRRLFARLRSQILGGHFDPGARLPSTRALAASLGVSRNTVINAFEQLAAEGYLRARSGSGSYVTAEPPDKLIQSSRAKTSSARKSARRLNHPFGATADRVPLRYPRYTQIRPFMPGIPALDAFPYAVWTQLMKRQWRRRSAEMLSYADPAGYPPLREAIYSYLTISRGVQCEPEQVVIVAGTQQALQLVSRVLIKPGDPVWVEEPGYFAAQAAFKGAAAKVIPVDVDSDGLKVSAGIAANPKARVVYTTPGHQFPLGASMSIARRMELLRWASKSGAWIVEDDYDGEFRYSSRPLPALQSLDRNGNVIYVGSLSKMLFPALRLGYMVVPSGLLTRILTAKYQTDWHSPTSDQAIVSDFFNDGHFMRHIRKMRALYLERLEAMLAGAHSDLNGALNIARPDAGMHVVATLQLGVDDRAVASTLDNKGISSFPVSLCRLGDKRAPALLLGFAAYTPKQIKQGCRLLAAALESL